MFNSVNYDYNSETKIYHFRVNLGNKFYNTVAKIGYPVSSQKLIFLKKTLSEFSIERFFIPDLLAILGQVIEVGSVYDVNMKAVNNLLRTINDIIIANNRNTIPLDLDQIDKFFIYKPLVSQLPAYEAYRNIRAINGSRGMILDGAVGVGKTYISLSLAKALRSEVVLIVAPLSTITKVWEESLAGPDKLYKHDQNYLLIDKNSAYNGQDYLLCSYENIKYILPLYKDNNINITTLIVDEVHNFNDNKSNRTQELIQVSSVIPLQHAIPMSGTPIKAKPKDLATLFRIINSDFNKRLETKFMKIYTHRGYLKTEVLRERYLNHTVVLKKSYIDIPPLTTPTIKIKIPNGKTFTIDSISKRLKKYIESRTLELNRDFEQYKKTYINLYTKAKNIILTNGVLSSEAVAEYESNIDIILIHYKNNALGAITNIIRNVNIFEGTYIEPQLSPAEKIAFRDAKTVYKYLSLKVQGEALSNVVMRARIDCYSLLASNIDIKSIISSTIKKTIIFSSYTEVCDMAFSNCVNNKLRPITVYGATTKNLTTNVGTFINNKNTNPLITTYKSLSTGVPLVVANVILIFGLPFRQYVFEQAIGRAWRTGQDAPVKAYIVELDTGSEHNITDRDFDIINFYKEEVEAITGKTDSVIIDRYSDNKISNTISDLTDLSNEHYIDKLLKSNIDIITKWRL